MLKNIYKILPLFIIEFIARKKCEVVKSRGVDLYTVFNDVFLTVKK